MIVTKPHMALCGFGWSVSNVFFSTTANFTNTRHNKKG